jgi:multiple sugar transport system substrate-binding protein
MNRTTKSVLGLAAASALVLTGCSSGGGDDTPQANPFPTGDVTITLSGWSLATTPEFQKLVDGFEELHSNVTVTIKEYDPAQYDTLLTADLSSNAGPDIITQKTFKMFYTYVDGGALLDVSDVTSALPDTVNGKSSYTIDDASYAVPYRQDSWVLYYNKDLFDTAGVDYPDGTWTWDDYADAAEKLTTGLQSAGSTAVGTYEHSWQSTVQGFANAQSPNGLEDIIAGKFDHLKPYYERVLDLQNAGAQVPLGTVTTNHLTYQAQFGKQSAAMMPMGSWFVATLLSQQKSGDADTFEWGIAPAPQRDSSTTGTDKTPVTFGDPTGFAINAGITDGDKLAVAKEFLKYAASADAAKALASIGITPANTSDEVAATYFGLDGIPTDDLSKFAWSKHTTLPENPVSKYTAGIQNLLNALHTAVLSGSSSIDQAITDAEDQAKTTVLNQ